ncbi:AMP-binding acetyl-CoA synthetase [Hahella sp. KA22]|uniref:AMP-binding protein n=1 Tax=Hahella sp. KA22 TaxID=1628392 RepID=UPI000FDDC6CD|nr:AMP-binding protein [Hahella sp. KA22]AZZ93350.1 AMP-binding acetyl-CoA synthetase [Hahella sp. KA22]QAY56724.1 AMP-binding acetyl-CoA synthetase [Hahella sp. KA22]
MELHTHIPTPLQRLYHWEKSRPGDVFMTQPMGDNLSVDYTFQRTAQEARRMAAYLRSLGLPEDAKVAILSKNCAHWIMSDLAIWMAGYVSVPLYPTLSADSVQQILEHSEAKVLFVGKLDDWDTMKAGVPDDVRCISYPLSPPNDFPTWEDIVAKTHPLEESPPRKHEELATIVYTSGSTGMPKGVMLSFNNLAFAADGVVNFLDVGSHERMLSYLPLSHVFERFVVEMGALYTGFHVFFAESLDTFVRDLKAARPTLFLAVPRIWTKFQAGVLSKMPEEKLNFLLKIPGVSHLIRKKVLKGLGLEYVRFAGSGSAPLSQDILSWYRRLGLELLEGYGMSENFAYSHMTKPGRTKVGFVGEALPGVDVRVGSDGEILVKSPATMMGYYKEPDKTTEALTEDGFLRTGDLGEVDELGRLKLTGRKKELFKTSKGKYVAPAPIENRIISHPQIEMVCVAGSDYPQPHCLVMLSDDAYPKRTNPDFRQTLEKSLQNLLQDINASVDPHERLQFLAVVSEQWTIENNFLTPTMKLKRNVIEEAYKPHLEQWYSAKAPVIWQ